MVWEQYQHRQDEVDGYIILLVFLHSEEDLFISRNRNIILTHNTKLFLFNYCRHQR